MDWESYYLEGDPRAESIARFDHDYDERERYSEALTDEDIENSALEFEIKNLLTKVRWDMPSYPLCAFTLDTGIMRDFNRHLVIFSNHVSQVCNEFDKRKKALREENNKRRGIQYDRYASHQENIKSAVI